MKTVIIAAGMSSRIWNETDNRPKTLLPFAEGTILSTILSNFHQVGVTSFVIVVGYQSELIKNYLEKNECFGYEISFIENLEWEKGNGISVLAAQPEITDEVFLLSMSDHIVAPVALRRITNHKSTKNLLLVDSQTEKIYDINDATKVYCEGSRIVDIGKNITQYNGVDCGIFKLKNSFFRAMKEVLEYNQDSISAAIKVLIKDMNMKAVFLKAEEKWIDIDTPESYQYSLDFLKP